MTDEQKNNVPQQETKPKEQEGVPAAPVNKSEDIPKTYDIEGLIGGAIAGIVIGILISFDALFAMVIGMFFGLVIGTRMKKDKDAGKDKNK